jgi:23S rRNA (cytosine1962-C5)-methyltransferase
MDELLMHGGYLLLCLNAPELGPAFLQDQMKEFAPGFTFVTRVDNPPEFADASDDRSLKVLVYRSPAMVG